MLTALERIRALGVEYVILFVHVGGPSHAQIMASMRLFATEVSPRLVEGEQTSGPSARRGRQHAKGPA